MPLHQRRRLFRPISVLIVVAAAAAACHSGADRPLADHAKKSATHAPVVSTTTTSTAAATTTTTTVPVFASEVSTVSQTQLAATWHVGCPVDPSQLRMIQMSYWGFDGKPHSGTMIVNASVVNPVISVFSTLYANRFPLTEMIPVSAYGGDDNAAAAADDTSGFNCRDAVAPGPPQWSMHAYGEAIDVNDLENPYTDGTRIIPAAGAPFLNRSDVRPGMAVPGGVLISAFASIGWQWGGRWTGTPDYQHFSTNGK